MCCGNEHQFTSALALTVLQTCQNITNGPELGLLKQNISAGTAGCNAAAYLQKLASVSVPAVCNRCKPNALHGLQLAASYSVLVRPGCTVSCKGCPDMARNPLLPAMQQSHVTHPLAHFTKRSTAQHITFTTYITHRWHCDHGPR